MPPAATAKTRGEGSDALAFVFAACVAAMVLLPATRLLDLKRASALMGAAALCLGLLGSRRWTDWERLGLRAWRWAVLFLCVYSPGLQGFERLRGSFGNAGYFAAFLCLSWPLFLDWPARLRPWALALIWFTILATGSRAALVALALQGLVLAWREPRWRKAGALSALAVAAGAVLMLGRSGLLRPTLRWELWQQTWSLAWQRPWTGWGLEGFALATEGRWSVGMAEFMARTGQYAEHPHQLLLSVFFHAGLLGLAVLAAVTAGTARFLLSDRDTAGRLLGLGLLGLLAHAQLDRFFFHAGLLGPLGLMLGLRGLHAGSAAWPKAPRFPRRVLALAGALALAWLAVRPILDWRNAVVPGAALGMPLGGAADAGDPAELKTLAQGSVDPVHWDRLGSSLAARQDFQAAADAFREALVLEPNAGRARNLGNCLFALGRMEQAESLFRQAVQMNPAEPDSHFSLGYALFHQGRLREAVAALDEALRLDPGHAEAATLKHQILQ